MRSPSDRSKPRGNKKASTHWRKRSRPRPRLAKENPRGNKKPHEVKRKNLAGCPLGQRKPVTQ
jgi:hypothetical protein